MSDGRRGEQELAARGWRAGTVVWVIAAAGCLPTAELPLAAVSSAASRIVVVELPWAGSSTSTTASVYGLADDNPSAPLAFPAVQGATITVLLYTHELSHYNLAPGLIFPKVGPTARRLPAPASAYEAVLGVGPFTKLSISGPPLDDLRNRFTFEPVAPDACLKAKGCGEFSEDGPVCINPCPASRAPDSPASPAPLSDLPLTPVPAASSTACATIRAMSCPPGQQPFAGGCARVGDPCPANRAFPDLGATTACVRYVDGDSGSKLECSRDVPCASLRTALGWVQGCSTATIAFRGNVSDTGAVIPAGVVLYGTCPEGATMTQPITLDRPRVTLKNASLTQALTVERGAIVRLSGVTLNAGPSEGSALEVAGGAVIADHVVFSQAPLLVQSGTATLADVVFRSGRPQLRVAGSTAAPARVDLRRAALIPPPLQGANDPALKNLSPVVSIASGAGVALSTAIFAGAAPEILHVEGAGSQLSARDVDLCADSSLLEGDGVVVRGAPASLANVLIDGVAGSALRAEGAATVTIDQLAIAWPPRGGGVGLGASGGAKVTWAHGQVDGAAARGVAAAGAGTVVRTTSVAITMASGARTKINNRSCDLSGLSGVAMTTAEALEATAGATLSFSRGSVAGFKGVALWADSSSVAIQRALLSAESPTQIVACGSAQLSLRDVAAVTTAPAGTGVSVFGDQATTPRATIAARQLLVCGALEISNATADLAGIESPRSLTLEGSSARISGLRFGQPDPSRPPACGNTSPPGASLAISKHSSVQLSVAKLVGAGLTVNTSTVHITDLDVTGGDVLFEGDVSLTLRRGHLAPDDTRGAFLLFSGPTVPCGAVTDLAIIGAATSTTAGLGVGVDVPAFRAEPSTVCLQGFLLAGAGGGVGAEVGPLGHLVLRQGAVSRWGTGIQLLAPGTDVWTLIEDTGYSGNAQDVLGP